MSVKKFGTENVSLDHPNLCYMKNIFLLLSFLVTLTVSHAQTPVNLQFRINGLSAGNQVYLAYYYGNKQYVKDTAEADQKGLIRFSYNQPLDQGIYMLVFPSESNKFMEFIVDADQQFDMSAKLTDLIKTAVFKGSEENTLFFDYVRKIEVLKIASDNPDANAQELDNSFKTIKNELVQKHPKSFTAQLLLFQDRPEIPATIVDKTEQFYYYRSHFFDGKDWNFTAIARTPTYQTMMDEYIDQLTIQSPDSLIVSCDLLLSKVKQNKELFKYTLITLTNKYAASKTICFDNVYLHLVDQYYLSGRAFWLSKESEEDQKTLQRMKERVDRLRHIQCGKPVVDFTLQDEKGANHSLYDIESPYTLLMFWSTDCQHCEQSIKKMTDLDPLLKRKGVTFVTVADGTNKELWLKKKATFPVKDILALMSTESTVIQTLVTNYDIYSTPSFFLLDADKKLLYKKFEVEDLKQILESYPDK